MNNINIGDYVRTKNIGGSIEKIIEIFPKEKTEDLITRYATDISAKYCLTITKDEIIKSSSNIIDLIEVGDYVNGEQITDIRNDDNINNEKLLYYYIPSDWGEDYFREKDIKSIVTKEQFKAMEYRIGE